MRCIIFSLLFFPFVFSHCGPAVEVPHESKTAPDPAPSVGPSAVPVLVPLGAISQMRLTGGQTGSPNLKASQGFRPIFSKNEVSFKQVIPYKRDEELYLVWPESDSSSGSDEKVIHAVYHYQVFTSTNSVVRLRTSQEVSYHFSDRVWFIPFFQIFKTSEDVSQFNVADTQEIILDLTFSDFSHRSYVVRFRVQHQL